MLPERLSFVYLCSSDPLCCLSSPLCLGVAAARAEGAGDVIIPSPAYQAVDLSSQPSPLTDKILPLVQLMVSPEHRAGPGTPETGKEHQKYGIAGMKKVKRRRALYGHYPCHSSIPSPAPLWPSSDDFLFSLCPTEWSLEQELASLICILD